MTTPTGQFSLLLWNCSMWIGSSASFQAACGITSETHATALLRLQAAQDRIYFPGQEMPDPPPRPFAQMRIEDGSTFSAPDSGGAGFFPQFPLRIMLEQSRLTEDTPREQSVKFWNFVGAVTDELQTLAKGAVHADLQAYVGATSYLQVTQMTIGEAARSGETEKDSPYFQIFLYVKVW